MIPGEFRASNGLHGSNPIHGEARDDLGKLEECKVRIADHPKMTSISSSTRVVGCERYHDDLQATVFVRERIAAG